MTWAAQGSFADRFDVVLYTRSGYPPKPALERIDFEQQADELATELRAGDHLVGHSYGGVVSLLAAARGPKLASLTVNEPPAFDVARGNAVVEDFLASIALFRATAPSPREYLDFFLPPALEAGARAAMAERSPHEAKIPLDELAAAPLPMLVVSGGHNAAFDAVCDVLESRLGAERAVVRGAGHSLPRAPGYNDVLLEFLVRV
jgi:pimeloyl-ACP methyl ester carboxylesterase